MSVKFSFHSSAARKARLRMQLSPGLRAVMFITSVLLASVSGLVWTQQESLASILLASSVWVALPLIWFHYELRNLFPTDFDENKIILEETLPADVVGRLRSVNTPAQLWQGIRGSWQQNFFCARFNINPDIFNQLSSESGMMSPIWKDAARLSKHHKVGHISVASLMVALIKSLPNYQELLANSKLDIEELENSIDWLHHTDYVIRNMRTKRHYGGLARDWTFGYTPQLNRLAHNMSSDVERGGLIHRDLSVHSNTVNEIIQFIDRPGRRNVALVGETGAGKTTTVYSFAQRLLVDPKAPKHLKYHQVHMLDAARILAQTDDGSKIEAIVLGVLGEAQKAKNIVLFLDDANLFFAKGTGSVNLSHVLLPLIEDGGIPLIMAFTPDQWQDLSANNSHIAGLINYLAVPEPDEKHTMQILEDQTLLLESQYHVTYTYQALRESYRLSERYEHEKAFPGRAISVLELAVNHAENGFVTEMSVQSSLEAVKGVKIQKATTEEKDTLLDLENEIHKRLVNQSRAVKVVADALRRARSGVNNPNKPIGTFMFLGPTGVGKTELAKAIASTYFRGEDQIIRVDMNEYTQSTDVARLLDNQSSSGLINSIRRQPFSVVLFDEIEKAHPDVINVFLQMLDEGSMRDVNNKDSSFKDAIIIATSNAGADIIRQQISAGYQVADFEKIFINQLIDGGQFKPEFINRFDEIVVFRPLSPEELLTVVELMVAGVNKTLKRQKVSVEISDEAKRWLVDTGNDPRLGARPIRRMIQRTVENLVAKRLLEEKVKPGTVITLSKNDLELENE